MDMDLNALRQKLADALESPFVGLVDQTPEHAGHPASLGKAHLALTLVSPHFEGLSLLDRHRLVHRALEAEMAEWIHALSLKTLSPQEWQSIAPTASAGESRP